jgi:hypothetical protein
MATKRPSMKYLSTAILIGLVQLMPNATIFAQNWPVVIEASTAQTIKVYAPQSSAYANNQLMFRSAVAIQKRGEDNPVFGVIWAKAQVSSIGADQLQVQSLAVTDLRFPSTISGSSSGEIETSIEVNLPKLAPPLSKKSVQESLQLNKEKQSLDQSFSTKAPRVIYSNHPAMLVLTDGDPVWQKNEDWGVEAVVNSPNTIIRNGDGRFYIYGSQQWWVASSLDGNYQAIDRVPQNFNKIAAAISASDKNKQGFDSDFQDKNESTGINEIIVSTTPAELIQTNGEAAFSPIANTGLMYVENSPNDIFMEVQSQQYYILLSGRWYVSKNMKGSWTNISADQLPQDFAQIPEGSPKDNVLASVAGTQAAKNAILDAQVPQTARVNRNSASASVDYDGDPEFEDISGTRLAYAKNTASPVIRYNRQYFLVDNGIWFQSNRSGGPWVASNYRPDDIDLIPPSYPVYNVKYVYIYDVDDDYIYTGYTPGYLNTYIYGSTIVYGTGYYYRPWHRRHYYPRPCTWGFNMHYLPWSGWSFGVNFYGGWFNSGYYGYQGYDNWGGGWWGPSRYRPAYCGPSYSNRGYYGYRNNYPPQRNYYGNVYNGRRDVVAIERPSRPAAGRDYHIDNRPVYNRTENNRNPTNQPQNNRPNYGRNEDSRPVRQYQPQPDNRPRQNTNGGERPQNRIERYQQDERRAPQRQERNERPVISNRQQSAPPVRQAPPARRDNEVSRPERRSIH